MCRPFPPHSLPPLFDGEAAEALATFDDDAAFRRALEEDLTTPDH